MAFSVTLVNIIFIRAVYQRNTSGLFLMKMRTSMRNFLVSFTIKERLKIVPKRMELMTNAYQEYLKTSRYWITFNIFFLKMNKVNHIVYWIPIYLLILVLSKKYFYYQIVCTLFLAVQLLSDCSITIKVVQL